MGIDLLPAHIGAGINDALQPQLGLLVGLIILVAAKYILGAASVSVLLGIDIVPKHRRITKSTGSGSAIAPPPPELRYKYVSHYDWSYPMSLVFTILIKIEI